MFKSTPGGVPEILRSISRLTREMVTSDSAPHWERDPCSPALESSISPHGHI